MAKIKHQYTFGIRGITLVGKYLDDRYNKLIDSTSLEYNLTSNPLLDKENKILYQVVKVEIREKGIDTIRGSATIACAFSITGNIDVFAESNTENEINSGLEINTRLEALSTLRGVVFAEFKGSYLSAALIPLVNAHAMTKTDDPASSIVPQRPS